MKGRAGFSSVRKHKKGHSRPRERHRQMHEIVKGMVV